MTNLIQLQPRALEVTVSRVLILVASIPNVRQQLDDRILRHARHADGGANSRAFAKSAKNLCAHS
jgi:hypothetical protein